MKPKLVFLKLLKQVTTESFYIKLRYFYKFKKIINLKNPETFTEKINWIKIFCRDPRLPELADKYEVRNFVGSRIGKDHLVKLIGVYNNPGEIRPDTLPRSFVLKPNHGAGWIIRCFDNNKLDWPGSIITMKKWLSTNYGKQWGEWAYQNIPPRIICEEFLKESDKDYLTDYKFYCFDGEPKIFHIDRNRYIRHTRNIFDPDGNPLPFGIRFPREENPIPKPHRLMDMVRIAKTLSEGFPFVRIDLYEVNNRVYFSEMSFYPDGGFGKFKPDSYDLQIGKLFHLPGRDPQ